MPVTAPPRNATSSALPMPPRAASATRAFERTDTFMPMKPAAADAIPPIAKPIATSMSCRKISAMNSTTPTIPIVVYWRRRYACAPSWMASGEPLHDLVARRKREQRARRHHAVHHGEQRADHGEQRAVISQEFGQEKPLWTQTKRNGSPDRAAV